jgi:excisionase family DNA binding protein
MQAYASSERLTLGGQAPLMDPAPVSPSLSTFTSSANDDALIQHLLGKFADLVVERLIARTATTGKDQTDGWMDAREAADYLGVHRDTLRKLAAERAVPAHQDGPGCKLYFNRGELDEWRRAARAPRSRRLSAVS